MVDNVAATVATVPPNMFRPSGVSGRLAIPVNPLNALYARFDHVVGVPAKAGATVSVLKLKILDDMLDRQTSDPVQQNAGVDDRIVSLLETARARSSSPFSAGSFDASIPAPGSYFDLAA